MADNCSYSLASSSVFKIVQTLTVKTRRKLTSLFLKMIVQQLDIGYIFLEFGKDSGTLDIFSKFKRWVQLSFIHSRHFPSDSQRVQTCFKILFVSISQSSENLCSDCLHFFDVSK